MGKGETMPDDGMPRQQVRELRVLDPDGSSALFDRSAGRYVIPLYQRAYAWTEWQIEQLIDDIESVDDDIECYYLGSLVVDMNGERIEVIDGQQRLTTLLLILSYLKLADDSPKSDELRSLFDTGLDGVLSYECREMSDRTLNKIAKGQVDLFEDCDVSIVKGFRAVRAKFEQDRIDLDGFARRLAKVVVFRIGVPEHTDLNRYFEVMNTRGEQLEQHDVLKARLMDGLDDCQKLVFAEVWDACSCMNGYVQMNFAVDARDRYFGEKWDALITRDEFMRLATTSSSSDSSSCAHSVPCLTLDDVLRMGAERTECDLADDVFEKQRFESIVDFPHFLLHVLRVFAESQACSSLNTDSISAQIDDKALLSDFSGLLDAGKPSAGADGSGKLISEHGKPSLEFAYCLLKCRFLFDKYVIKREFASDDLEGKWSLKDLRQSSKRSAYYSNTFSSEIFDDSTKESDRGPSVGERCLMLQSALRVSYTSPKSMNWITDLLKWLYLKGCIKAVNLLDQLTAEVQSRVYDALSSVNLVNAGTSTPRIVFNYLDYLLWSDNPEKFADFVFEFRNSVEHWHPQHLISEGNQSNYLDARLNCFGNLCLVSSSVNSKFSNLPPAAKKTFASVVSKGSIKLRQMADATELGDDWLSMQCVKHHNDMLNRIEKSYSTFKGFDKTRFDQAKIESKSV